MIYSSLLAQYEDPIFFSM